MLIGISILGMQVNTNVATNEVTSLIASKGGASNELIHESQPKFSPMFQEHDMLMVRVAHGVEEVGSPTDDSQDRSSPIFIANRGEEDISTESPIERSSSPVFFSRACFSSLSLDLVSVSPDLTEDEDFFNNLDSEDWFVHFGSSQSISPLDKPQRSATVTFTATNVVKKVPFGKPIPSHNVSVSLAIYQKPVNCPPPTPINEVQRTLRPSTRTDRGLLKEAQKNHLLPLEFEFHPKTGKERDVRVRRRPERLTLLRPLPPRDSSSTPALTTNQADHTVPTQYSAIGRSQEKSVFETCASVVCSQTILEEPKEIET